MKRILITGGCGFIGSNLAVDLVSRGYAVTVLDNLSRRGSEFLRARVLAHGVTVVHGDIRDPENLKGLGGDFALMIECSAESSAQTGSGPGDARYLLDVNLLGAINCFEWARERKVPVIFFSSSRIYPYDRINACRYVENETRFDLAQSSSGITPVGVQVQMPLDGVRTLYGASKLSAELILREYGARYELPSIINRCGVVAGPWQLGKIDQGVFTFWLASHFFKRPLNYTGFGGLGKQVRDLLHVDDLSSLVARQVQCLVDDDPVFRGEVFNVGGSAGVTLSLKETTAICAQLTGHRLEIGSVAPTRPGDLIWYVTDNGRTAEAFDWKPSRSAQDILQDTFQWIRGHADDLKDIMV